MLDEIITGVRINCSSIQRIYKLNTDISTFGKVAGGGMPIGIIGISKKVEKKLNSQSQKVFFGGTFSGNSLSMYVGNNTLQHLMKNKKKIFFKINSNSNFFVKNLNKEILKNNIKARVTNFFSVARIIFSEKNPKDRLQRDFFEKKTNSNRVKFIKFLKNNNIVFPNNGIIFYFLCNRKKTFKIYNKKNITRT